MRTLCLVAALMALPVAAIAQQADREHHDRREDTGADRARGGAPASPGSATPRPSGSLPAIGLPPAQNPGLPPWEQKQVPWWERQPTPSWERPSLPSWERPAATPPPAIAPHRDDRDDRDRGRDYRFIPGARLGGPVIVVVPAAAATPAPPPATAPALGGLRIDLEPRAVAQVFVDDVFVGAPEDHGGELSLAPGVRRVKLRARGYKTLAFDAEIVSGTSITYRGVLEEETPRATTPPPAAPARTWSTEAIAPTTIYVVPGCYLGNVAPKANDLKPGCDIRALIKRAP